MWQLLREKDAYYEYLMFISCLSSEKFKVLCWCYLLHPHMSASFEERTGKCLKSGSMLDIRWDQVLAFCTTPRSGLYSVFSAPVLEHKLDASNPSLILENPSLHSLRCLSVALRQKDNLQTALARPTDKPSCLLACFLHQAVCKVTCMVYPHSPQQHNSMVTVPLELRFSESPLTSSETTACSHAPIGDCILESWVILLSLAHPKHFTQTSRFLND